MLSIGLWRWYINITITILYIIFYLKHNVSDTVFCFRRQVEPTQMGPIEDLSPDTCNNSNRVYEATIMWLSLVVCVVAL
jgi:hypothetical protein